MKQSCVILVPVGSHIEPACEAGLQELERRGYVVWRTRGYSAIDQGRNQMASDALRQGFEETLWIDSDVGFAPDDVETLRRHQLPLCCAIYPKKGKRELAVHVIPGTKSLLFGVGGGLTELKYAATGFLHVRREVYDRMEQQLKLPVCNRQFGSHVVPYFQPLIVEDPGPHPRLPPEERNSVQSWYLGEDFAFCHRARLCGYPIIADTTIRLTHIGSFAYTWEDAGADPRRFATYSYHFPGAEDATEKPSG
jgi:hypothetical protein